MNRSQLSFVHRQSTIHCPLWKTKKMTNKPNSKSNIIAVSTFFKYTSVYCLLPSASQNKPNRTQFFPLCISVSSVAKKGKKWHRLGQVWRHFGAVWCHIGQVWHRFGQPWHQKYTQKPCFNAKNAENTKFPRLIQQKNLSGLTSFRL